MNAIRRMNLSAWWAETLWRIALGVLFALLIGMAAFVGLSFEQWLHPVDRV